MKDGLIEKIKNHFKYSQTKPNKFSQKGVKTIHSFFFTSILLLVLNTSYICENSKLELVMRNTINGDFSKIKTLSDLKPGGFININWNKKELMLPYSLRQDYISFTDKKWY